jgi:hypothetical protein
MNRDELLQIVRPLLECPTAPTYEGAVRDEIERQLRGIDGLKLQTDAYGNLIAWYCGEAPKYAFVAHMDHPGWQLRPVRRFLGGVPESLQDKGQVREFGDFGMWDFPGFRLDGAVETRIFLALPPQQESQWSADRKSTFDLPRG